MISREDIQNLAHLSRLKLSEREKDSLEQEFGAILDYIGRIEQAAAEKGAASVQNVMREDKAGGPSGLLRERLLDAAPAREGDYIAVRKIIAKDEE